MSYIGREPLGGEVILMNSIESQFDGVKTTFNLTRTISGVTSDFYPISSEQLLVSLGGVIQKPDTSGNTGFKINFNQIVFAVPPNAGVSCFVIAYGNVTDIGAPANNTVTTDKLVDGSVTPIKLSTGGPWWLSNGNVGIGTTNPTQKLDVDGIVKATSFTGALSGNATTATTLETARTIGGVSFNGSANIDLPGVNIAGNQNTTGSAATLTTTRTIWGQNFNGSANVTGALTGVTTLGMSGQLTNSVAVGTAPFVITSTTRVANLNVATAGTADQFTTGRTIALTGDVTGTSVAFNGSANLSFATTLANSGVTAGTYRSVTVDVKGRVTTGTNPTTLSGYGITDAVPSNRTLTIAGTTNQVTVSPTGAQDLTANRSWTLSLPQNIHTAAAPQFGGLTVSGNVGIGTTNPTRILDVRGDSIVFGEFQITDHLRMGNDIRDYASHFSTTHTVNQLYEMARLTVTASFQNITVIGEIRAGGGSNVGISKFIINIRTNSPFSSKSFTFTEEYISMNATVRVKLYHDTNSGLIVIGYIPQFSALNVGWNIRVQERGNYRYLQTVNSLTTLSTTGLTEVLLTTHTRNILDNTAFNRTVGIGTESVLTDCTLHISKAGAEGIEFYPGDVTGINRTDHYNRSTLAYITNTERALAHIWENNTGTEIARINSDGNVGIGNTNPQYKLDINGNLIFQPNNNGYIRGNNAAQIGLDGSFLLVGTNSGSIDSGIHLRGGQATTIDWAIFLRGSDNSLRFRTDDSSDVLLITVTGNVGINTLNPAEKLEVGGNLRFSNGADRAIYISEPGRIFSIINNNDRGSTASELKLSGRGANDIITFNIDEIQQARITKSEIIANQALRISGQTTSSATGLFIPSQNNSEYALRANSFSGIVNNIRLRQSGTNGGNLRLIISRFDEATNAIAFSGIEGGGGLIESPSRMIFGVGADLSTSTRKLQIESNGHVLFYGPNNNAGGYITTDGAGFTSEKLIINGNRGDGGIIFQTNPGEAARITNTGNFGIGSTNPVGKLQIVGGDLLVDRAFKIQFAQNDAKRSFIASSGVDNRITFGGVDNNVDVPWMTILPSGNVGIGSTNPDQKLVVGGNIKLLGSFQSLIFFNNTKTSATINSFDGGLNGEDSLMDININPINNKTSVIRLFRGTNTTGDSVLDIFRGDNTTTVNHRLSGKGNALLCMNSGNVGIGPTATLPEVLIDAGINPGNGTAIQVAGFRAEQVGTFSDQTTTTPYQLLQLGVSSARGHTKGGAIISGREGIYTTTTTTQNSYLSFETCTNGTRTPKVRISSTGNFGIGSSSPDSLLTLTRNLTDGQILINFDAHRGFDLRRIGPTDSSAGLFLNMRTGGNGMGFAFQGTVNAYFDTNGRLGLGIGQVIPGYRLELPNTATNAGGRGLANAWNTYSDDRVKINEEEIPYGLNTVMQLNPLKYFHLNSSKNEDGNIVIHEEGEESIGLIAQEVAELIPEIVSIPEDPDKELYALDYEKLTAVLIKAIQDQQEIINNLTTRIESLENI